MLGFDRRFSGNTISIYVMAKPTGSPTNLKADIFADGRFRSVQIVSDSSYGLTEPGFLTLAIPKAPDESNLLGETSHWLRLWPDGDASAWSPHICGLFLNGVLARSVETRSIERLGASNGTIGQQFQLAEAPLDPHSLVLRISEILGQQERVGLDIKTYPNGPPGEWVLWQPATDLSGDDKPSRAFTLDAHSGTLRFGDGDNGMIPPLGAELIAERYARVKGSIANEVKAGTKPTLLASLAGVDSVLTLDYAAGGSDTESALQARRRASGKLRHGDRILSVADLADFVPTLAPDIAQVRVIESARTTKIVVALTGPDPRPMPAKLRGIKRNIESVSGYGLRRPEGLEIVGPRLLPLGVSIELVPATADSYADAAVEAARLLSVFFDAATGGHDARGWPIGQLPKAQDIAAALMPIAELGFPATITLRRSDRPTGVEDKLPDAIPKDVLVRLDAAALLFERASEVVA
jgi:predicted phage baseplate assembly protein